MERQDIDDAILVISSMLNVTRRFGDSFRTVVAALNLETVLQVLISESHTSGECPHMELRVVDPLTGEWHVIEESDEETSRLVSANIYLGLLLGWAKNEPAIRGEERIAGRYLKALQASREIVKKALKSNSENCNL